MSGAKLKPTTERLIVGPFNRVEGDLAVQLDIADGQVQRAQVTAPMFRGFESMLVGRPAMDALVIVPRICGICSVSQSVASARALGAVVGAEVPANGQLSTNIMLAVENLADHLTHFYLFFMPDFCREIYAKEAWHGEATERFAAMRGAGARMALAARQRWFQILGSMGGKWPHTQSIQLGGVSHAVDAAERGRLLAMVREFRAFLERELFGDTLENVQALDAMAALRTWQAKSTAGDFRLFLRIADSLNLQNLGAGPNRYISFGAYPQAASQSQLYLYPAGVLDGGVRLALDSARITEDSSHAWYADTEQQRHPAQGSTQVDANKTAAYTWNKAPRYAGKVVETGALARQLMSGNALVQNAHDSHSAGPQHGGNVYTRILARMHELAIGVAQVEAWLQALEPQAPYFIAHAAIKDGSGVGLNEAARGSLGHWLEVEGGKIVHYQIIAPTGWNFSPRDSAGTPGALEAALVGAPVQDGEDTPVAVQHIVRSFDPCMVCTVH